MCLINNKMKSIFQDEDSETALEAVINLNLKGSCYPTGEIYKVRIKSKRLYMCVYIHMWVCIMYVCMYTHTHIYTYRHICIYMCVCVHAHACALFITIFTYGFFYFFHADTLVSSWDLIELDFNIIEPHGLTSYLY